MDKVIASLVLVLVLQGCSSIQSAYQSQDNRSQAWNISKAAGVNVEEISKEKLKELGGSYDEGNIVFDSLVQSGVADYALYASQGFLTLKQAALSFGGTLLLRLSEPDDPAFKDHIIAWMPTRSGQSTYDAVQDFLKTVVNNISKVDDKYIQSVDWVKTIEQINEIEKETFQSFYRFRVYFSGGMCDKFDCFLNVRLHDPSLVAAPDFLSSSEKDVRFYFGPDRYDLPDMFVTCALPNQFIQSGKPPARYEGNEFELCQAAMKQLDFKFITQLPSWINVYRAPNEKQSPLPTLQQQDRVMFYVR